MIDVELLGCPFQPLGAYLKALAVLRLVSKEDGSARGVWTNRCFVLKSSFDEEGLLEFFLSRYQPTPVLAPWNGGSGFYDEGTEIVDEIGASEDARISEYRRTIALARAIVERHKVPKNAPTAQKAASRTAMLRECRNTMADAAVEWLDAAVAISSDESRAFAPILGTGGNEGHLDYTNNFMQNVAALLLKPKKNSPVRALLINALFNRMTDGLQEIAVGQYDPGRCGGFNQGNGMEAKSLANPWNAVLTIEGAVAWAGGIYRRQGVSYRSFLCSPFTVKASAAGYGSAAEKDVYKDDGTAQAEIWTPLWHRPARFEELRALLREGRAAVDGKAAQSGLQFAEAAASLGVDRGIDAFVRYTFVKRRGKSYIALPAGKFPVTYRSTADLIREVTPLVDQAKFVVRSAKGDVPKSWPALVRNVEETVFRALLHGREHILIEVASGFGAIHRWLLQRNRQVPWRSKLSEAWIEKCSEDSVEARIAAALAGIWSEDAGRLLRNLTPGGLGFSWVGRDLAARMLSTLRRRTLDGSQSDRSPFWSRVETSASDVMAFLEHRTNDELLENLVFAFVLAKAERIQASRNDESYRRWPAYCVLKQLFAARTHPPAGVTVDEPRFRPDLAITGFLAANRAKEAVSSGIRRLRISGLKPVMRDGWDLDDATRLGASLLIPVWDIARLRAFVAETPELEETEV